ncbi:MAG: hypothetical protein EXR99_16300 [Gemmataceae bacterium]|nr:hypothetical protein [Gemmataceae bacterium]
MLFSWKKLAAGSLFGVCLQFSLSAMGQEEQPSSKAAKPNQLAVDGAPTKAIEEFVAPDKELAKEMAHAEESEPYRLKGFYMAADYYLARPRRDALDFAIVSNSPLGVVSGYTQSLYLETRSGFKFTMGKVLRDGWDINLSYFYLHSSDNQTINAPPRGALYSTLSNNTFDDVASATAMANLNYNVIDIDASREFQPAENFLLRVIGGGRFAWIDQNFSAIYNGGSLGATNDFVSSPVYFSGAGLTAGAEGTWACTEHFGLYGRAKGGILAGQFRNFLTETNNNGEVTFYNLVDKYQELVPVMELGAGLIIKKDHLHLKIGYELVNYFNMVNSLDFQALSFGKITRRMSDLSLEMLLIQGGITF